MATVRGTDGDDLSLQGTHITNIRDYVFGFDGNDNLFGLDGIDYLYGGDGNDMGTSGKPVAEGAQGRNRVQMLLWLSRRSHSGG